MLAGKKKVLIFVLVHIGHLQMQLLTPKQFLYAAVNTFLMINLWCYYRPVSKGLGGQLTPTTVFSRPVVRFLSLIKTENKRSQEHKI